LAANKLQIKSQAYYQKANPVSTGKLTRLRFFVFKDASANTSALAVL